MSGRISISSLLRESWRFRADSEINQDDIDRAMQASQAINLAERMVLHSIVREYIVDGVGISAISRMIEPPGSEQSYNRCVRTDVKNLAVFEMAGATVGGLVFPLAAARRSFENHKELRWLWWISDSATSLCVYDKLVHCAIFRSVPGHTNDLAIGLKTSSMPPSGQATSEPPR